MKKLFKFSCLSVFMISAALKGMQVTKKTATISGPSGEAKVTIMGARAFVEKMQHEGSAIKLRDEEGRLLTFKPDGTLSWQDEQQEREGITCIANTTKAKDVPLEVATLIRKFAGSPSPQEEQVSRILSTTKAEEIPLEIAKLIASFSGPSSPHFATRARLSDNIKRAFQKEREEKPNKIDLIKTETHLSMFPENKKISKRLYCLPRPSYSDLPFRSFKYLEESEENEEDSDAIVIPPQILLAMGKIESYSLQELKNMDAADKAFCEFLTHEKNKIFLCPVVKIDMGIKSKGAENYYKYGGIAIYKKSTLTNLIPGLLARMALLKNTDYLMPD